MKKLTKAQVQTLKDVVKSHDLSDVNTGGRPPLYVDTEGITMDMLAVVRTSKSGLCLKAVADTGEYLLRTDSSIYDLLTAMDSPFQEGQYYRVSVGKKEPNLDYSSEQMAQIYSDLPNAVANWERLKASDANKVLYLISIQ